MPRIKIQALTAGWVKRATKPGAYSDGYGLTLRIDARGNKRWVQRLTIRRRQRNLGLGSYPEVSIEEAREMALANWRAAREGRDPVAEKRMARTGDMPIFEDVARRVIALRRPTWSNDKHAAQWENSLATYVFPVIGRVPVDAVTTNDVLAVLEPIWNAKRRRPRGCASVWKWCLTMPSRPAGAWTTRLWPCPRYSHGGEARRSTTRPCPTGNCPRSYRRSERPPRTRSRRLGLEFSGSYRGTDRGSAIHGMGRKWTPRRRRGPSRHPI